MNRDPLEAWLSLLAGDLEGLEKKSRLRQLQTHSGLLDFSSNDYLSIVEDGLLEGLLRESLASYPASGATGSRLVSGHHSVFDDAETEFARFTGMDEALLFQSGYAANLGAISALLGPRDLAFADRYIHASIIDGIRLSGAKRVFFTHNDPEDLSEKLREHSPPGRGGRKWIFTETLFSMDGDEPDLSVFADLARKHDALLYIDEAHSIGLYGEDGSGKIRLAGLEKDIAVAVYPLGKAPGCMGAFVAGRVPLKSYLINHARSFLFSTHLPPFWPGLLKQLPEILGSSRMNQRRLEVFQKSTYFRERMNRNGFNSIPGNSPIVPILMDSDAMAISFAKKCRSNGLFIQAVRYPAVPADRPRLRIILHASQKVEDLDRLVDLLIRIKTTG